MFWLVLLSHGVAVKMSGLRKETTEENTRWWILFIVPRLWSAMCSIRLHAHLFIHLGLGFQAFYHKSPHTTSSDLRHSAMMTNACYTPCLSSACRNASTIHDASQTICRDSPLLWDPFYGGLLTTEEVSARVRRRSRNCCTESRVC